MDVLANLFTDLFLHLDKTLGDVIKTYDSWTYLILFAIIFIETGLVVMPFLPGDSLLFAAGVFAKKGSLNVAALLGLLSAAAIVGDTVNYWIGHAIGPKIFHKDNVRFMNRKHLDRAHAFYEKYGAVTIILARFMPIIRTFAPFVAGIGSMTYWKFLTYNVVGGIAWVVGLTMLGYACAGLDAVEKHFELVIIAIVLISILPMVIEYVRHRKRPAPKA
ncbi:MAG: VTT domain-containing protein [Planctomycetota bacterium]|nr:VTT domain-containing protein [Planctomycetota bacterium]